MSSLGKAWTFLTLIALTLLFLGHSLGGREGLLWSVVISLSINCYIYFFGGEHLSNRFLGRKIEGRDPWNLSQMLEKLTLAARIPKPEIYVIDSDAPQVIAIGHNWRHGRILLTQALIEKFSPEEINAILAYQVLSIKKLNTFLYLVCSYFAEVILLFTRTLDTLLCWILGANKNSNAIQSHFFSFAISPILASVLGFCIRGSYYQTDQATAELLNDPKILAEALWKLDSYSSTRPIVAVPSMAHLFMVNPLTRTGWTRYFHVHPSVRSRILKLVGHYPL